MIEIQCTSCHTRYRIDERVLPDETPTFKCSRCGHVFNAEPIPAKQRKPATPKPTAAPEPPPAEKPEPRGATEPETAPPGGASEQETAAPAQEPGPEPDLPRQEAHEEPVAGEEPEQELSPPPPPEDQPAQPESPPARDPFERTFFHHREDSSEPGENLSFTFTNEPPPDQDASASEKEDEHRPDTDDHWEVGEAEDHSMSEGRRDAFGGREEDDRGNERARLQGRYSPPLAPEFEAPLRAMRRGAVVHPRFPAGDFAREQLSTDPSRRGEYRVEIPDEVAYFTEYRAVHSSGWFLGLFAIIAMTFMGGWLMVHQEPEAFARMFSQAPTFGSRFQRPMVPATLVALHDVRADYQRLKGGQSALLISGGAENVGSTPLHAVLLSVDLLDDGGKQLAGGAAYCGNGLTAKMVGEMTPREIEFLQRLDPQKNFALDPSRTTPFLLVFIDPPGKLANLRIQVAKAVPVQNPRPHS